MGVDDMDRWSGVSEYGVVWKEEGTIGKRKEKRDICMRGGGMLLQLKERCNIWKLWKRERCYLQGDAGIGNVREEDEWGRGECGQAVERWIERSAAHQIE